MTIVPDRGWDRLDAATKEVVVAVIAEAESTGEYACEEFGELDIHARPYGDDVAWGVVNGADSFCVARGVWPRTRSAEIAVEHQQETSQPALDRRERATVLAALRYWQREGPMSAGGEHDIATDGDHVAPLTAAEIDTLCARLNVHEATLSETVAASDALPEQAEPTIWSDRETEAAVALADALAAWKEQRQLGPASGIIPLRPDAGPDDPIERRNANMAWADQFDAARDEAEFHRVFTALQNDPAVDAKSARHIAFVLTGDRHETREAALGGIETHFYQQRDQQEQAQAPARGGVAR
jgi:hypothetical protein